MQPFLKILCPKFLRTKIPEMKTQNSQLAYILLFTFFSFGLKGQTSTSQTYSAGHIGTESNGFTPRSVATNSTCPGLLTVNVPIGRYVTGVDVVYDMEALGFSALPDQWSYLECTSTGNQENQESASNGFGPGVESYSRTGLNIANGIVSAGGVQFELHAFRDFSFFGCNTLEQRVNNNTWTVTVHHVAAPTCLPPSNITVTGISTNSANLSWTSGGASNWQIEYGPTGFTSGTGTLIGVSTNPFSLSGLSANTTYDFQLRDSCGPTSADLSFWSSISSFTTACGAITAPWSEDFEGADWLPSNGFGGIGAINSCFNRNTSGDLVFVTGPPPFAPPTTGPSGDHTSGSGKYAFSDMVGFGGASPFNARLKTPPIDLSGLTSPELSVWYHMYGADIGNFQVAVSANGGVFTVLNTVTGQQQTSKSAAWNELIIDLSSYANDTVVVRFRSQQTTFGFDGNVAIDDLSIYEKPTCPKPTAVTSTGKTQTSITLNWTTGGASHWQIEYGPVGFSLGSGTLLNVSTNPFTVAGLSNSSAYDFYLRDSCSSTDLSSWVGPLKANTTCGVIIAPYLENFDGSSFVPPVNFNDTGDVNICWARNMTDYYWTTGPSPFGFGGTGPSGDHTTGSGQYSYTEVVFGFGGSFTAYLESPSIDLSALTNPQLSFWYHMFGADIGSMNIEIDNGSGYTNLITYSGQQQTSSTDLWKEAIISLSSYANDTVKIRFKGNLPVFGFQSQMAIDDLEIGETPTCPKPQSVQITSTSNSATVSWTTGGSNNWQVEYGNQGFTIGSGTLINTPTNPLTINGLSPNTIYDFYVRDSCGVSDLSAWVGPINDTTECTAFVAPYIENFDGTDWVITNGFNAGGISQCWSRNATNGFYWTTEQFGTNSNNTGPSEDHTSGSGKYVYSEGFTFNGVTEFSSPSIDISSLTSPEMRFWYHMFGANIDRLEVEVYDGTNWTLENTITGQQHTASTNAWDEKIVSLASYSGIIKVRFIAYGSNFGFEGNMALDDFWVGNTPTCQAPSNISTTSTTLNSITLDWVSGGASNWQLKYRVSGSTGAYTTLAVTTKPITVTSLNASSTYEFLVQDSCGLADVSFWVGPHFENTKCGTIIAPWTESFDGGSWVSGAGFDNNGNQIDPCWNRNTAIPQQWGTRTGTTNSAGTGPSGAFSGNNYIFRESSGGANGSATVTSPRVFVHPGIQSPKLYFHYHMFGGDITSLEIEISKNGNAFNSIYSKLGEQQLIETDPWQKDSVDLSSYSGDTIVLRFIGDNTGFLGDIALDEINISGLTSPCFDPSNLTISNLGTNSLDINWTSNNPGLTQLTYYDGAIGLPGITVNNISSPYSISGLTPNTSYVILLKDSCSATATSSSISDTIKTVACSSITAGFNFSSSILTASFTSTSVNADSLLWNFDGTVISNLTNPNHTYTSAGTYSVKLIAFNGCGVSDTVVQTVQICDSLKAHFSFSQNGDTLNYTAASSVGANSYSWDFGDGNDTNAVQNGSHIYSNSGTYTVTLTIYNSCGDSAVYTETTNSCAAPVANWTYTLLGTTGAGMEVQFDATQSLNSVNFKWDFGDGNTNTTASQPKHTYVTPSLMYTVSLTVTNTCNQTDKMTYRLDQIGLADLSVFHTELDVYPNPVTDIIKISLVNGESELSAQIKLYDISGRIVKEGLIRLNNSDETTVDIGNIPIGVYTLEILLDNETQHFPLIRQ